MQTMVVTHTLIFLVQGLSVKIDDFFLLTNQYAPYIFTDKNDAQVEEVS